ncbi:hypothetical protein [Echinimonas agarilytica]|uniref:protein O-GlcNAc transferase n=1 Tax=Echinimonas agarilytica TaxID=1215918 RepID=A0AA41W5K0_9GAMM|nr:hypothetical protein [Echinimonas agarilytica]MCM2678947.1 hypothetical protein [Echinimonas agarilytica]
MFEDRSWNKDFSKPCPAAQELIREQLELSYKQGSIKRVYKCAQFLDKYQLIADKEAKLLAEAGLKTGHKKAALLGCQRLVELDPSNHESVQFLLQSYMSVGDFKHAHQTSQILLAQGLVDESFVADLNDKISLKHELENLIIQLFSSPVSTSESELHFSQVQQVLQLAADINDMELCFKVVTGCLSARSIPNAWVISIFDLLTEKFDQNTHLDLLDHLRIDHYWADFAEHFVKYCSLNSKSIDAQTAQKLLAVVQGVPGKESASLALLVLTQQWSKAERLLAKNKSIQWQNYSLKSLAKLLCNLNKMDALDRLIARNENTSAEVFWLLAAGLEGNSKALERRLQLLQQASKLSETSSQIANDLGDVYFALGRHEEAKNAFYKAYSLAPDENFYTCYNLAMTLQVLGGNKQALDYYKVALSIDPERSVSWKAVGNFMSASGSAHLAHDAFRLYLAVYPNDVEVWLQYATMLQSLNEIELALDIVEEISTQHPNNLTAKVVFSGLNMTLGKATQARQINEQLLYSKDTPHHFKLQALGNALFASNYDPKLNSEELYGKYSLVQLLLPKQKYFEWNASGNNKKIRVGYVSADFKTHACAYFIEPLLSHYNHDRFEVFAYSGVNIEDEYTDLFKGKVDHWRYIAKLSDDKAAELIRSDEIDILVDLSGHTSGSRLSVLALKPAPIQMSWLGYGYTTGLPQVDYFLCDWEMAPEGSEMLFYETPLRLDRPSFTIKPHQKYLDFEPKRRDLFDGSPIVFGSATRAIRINDQLIAAWAEIISRVPNSILNIDNPNFADPYSAEQMTQRFVDAGIPREQLKIEHAGDYFNTIAAMDICLDCFPHNSGTTIFEMLWCGTPVITKRDRPSVGRIGVSIVQGVGRPEWIADSVEEYIEKAVSLALDRERLAMITKSLRNDFKTSQLYDGEGFCRSVERAYEHILSERFS